jgi:hypothetical protein
MDARSHWENVYTTKAPDAVSWYRPHLEQWTTLDCTPCPVPSCPAYEPNSGSLLPKPINKSLIASRGADIVMAQQR